MEPFKRDEAKREAIAKALIDVAKFLGKYDELEEYTGYLNSVDTAKSNASRGDFKRVAPTWLNALLPTIETLYNSGWNHALMFLDSQGYKFPN